MNDIDSLLVSAMEMASEMLKKFSEFHPFGIAVNSKGEIEFVQSAPGASLEDDPIPEEIIQALCDFFKADKANKWQLFGIVLNVTVSYDSTKLDALSVTIQGQKDRKAAAFVIPYAIESGHVIFTDKVELPASFNILDVSR
ncbi:MAG: hypothetical protein AB7W16_10555 [Candidatus Obscuribacterales bacterium]